MPLALRTPSRTGGSKNPLHGLRDRVSDWDDAAVVAQAVAELLREGAPQATATVLLYEPGAESLTLLASAPAAPGDPPLGSHFPVREGVVRAAVETGATQRQLNSYVHPEFVRCAPGEIRSRLVVPARAGAAVHGVVVLEYPAPYQPSAADEDLADVLADQLGLAFHYTARRPAVPDEGSERQHRQTALLAAVSRRLAQSSDTAAVTQLALDGLLSVLGADSATVLLRHPERQMLEVAATAGAERLRIGELVPLDGSAPGSVVRGGNPRVVRAESGTEPFSPTVEVRDALIVPLGTAGKVYGVLAVLDRGGEEPYGTNEVELLQGVASLLGTLEVTKQVAQLQQRISDGSIIAEVGRAVTGTLGLDDVLALVVQAAQMLANAQCATVGLVSEDEEVLTLVAASGVLRSAQGQTLPLASSLMGWVSRQGEAVISDSVSDDPRSSPHPVRQGPGVVVPLESRGKARGALLAARAEGATPPTEQDLDALRKLASFAAIAIDNAQLYRAQKETAQALRAKSDELERAYAELRESQDRLVVSEKMAALGRLTAGIAHEINSPLGSILNCLQLSQSYTVEYRDSIRDPDVTSDDHESIAKDLLETLELAEGATRKVAEFVRTIKGQTRMHDEEVRAFRPADEIDTMLALLQHTLRNRQVEVRVEAEPGLELLGDSGKFAVVLQNLVSNAVDAYQGAAGEVVVRLRAQDGACVLEVEDRGSGIPEAIRGKIFDYLFTTKDIGQGTGLGLSMVHSIVSTHFNGSIDLRSEVGSGTTFIVTFPANHGNV